jgi:hypothetical protein
MEPKEMATEEMAIEETAIEETEMEEMPKKARERESTAIPSQVHSNSTLNQFLGADFVSQIFLQNFKRLGAT